jgi:type IV secretion system protein VirD4
MELDLKDRVRILAGIVMTLAIAVIASSMVLNAMTRDFNGSPVSIIDALRDFSLQTDAQKIAAVIFGGVVVLCIVFIGVMIFSTTTTRYGTAHFQSIREMRKNGFLTPLEEGGLIFGKVARPPKEPRGRPLEVVETTPKEALRAEFISAPIDAFPQCLLIGPTRSGKGISYLTPNCLVADGSLVVLDVKGEIFRNTSRMRVELGDEVYRFAPYDFENGSHHYNPLARIAAIPHPNRQYAELDKLADSFLVTKGGGAGANFLGGAKQWFIAACLRAMEMGDPTLTRVHALMFGDGSEVGVSDSDRYNAIAKASAIAIVRREFSNFGNLDPKIRQSYSQVMSDSGLKQWANPQIQAVTRRDDIRFDDIRTRRQSIYIVVQSDDLSPLNAVVRLMFTDLIASIRQTSSDHDSGLGQVFIMLDEFDQLGYMPIVQQSMKQLAGHGARTTVVTQSIPGLKSVGYSDAEIESLIAGCEMKLYISPNDHSTTEEITKALGTRTGFKASYSYTLNDASNRSVNVSTEELPLMSPAQLRRLPKTKMLLMPEGHLPILADKIVYYADPVFKRIFESQKGPYPYPSRDLRLLDRLEQQVARDAVQNRQLREALAEVQRFAAGAKGGNQRSATIPKRVEREDLDNQMSTIEHALDLDAEQVAVTKKATKQKHSSKAGG